VEEGDLALSRPTGKLRGRRGGERVVAPRKRFRAAQLALQPAPFRARHPAPVPAVREAGAQLRDVALQAGGLAAGAARHLEHAQPAPPAGKNVLVKF
jgi:hypothetical protein